MPPSVHFPAPANMSQSHITKAYGVISSQRQAMAIGHILDTTPFRA